MNSISEAAVSGDVDSAGDGDRQPYVTLADHWNELSSLALLGAERRPVPSIPYSDLEVLLERIEQPDPARRLLTQVAAMSAARRAGLRPNPPVPPLRPAPVDHRAICPQSVVDRLELLLIEWPELLQEFLELVGRKNWRLTPDAAVTLMTRLRTQPALRKHTEVLTGPLAAWLIELFPAQLRLPQPKPKPDLRSDPNATIPESATSGSELAVPPDIAELLTIREPTLFAGELARRLQVGALANRNRASLHALIRRLDPSFLEPLADALERAATNPHTMGLALSLGDLARFRQTMIQEFDQ